MLGKMFYAFDHCPSEQHATTCNINKQMLWVDGLFSHYIGFYQGFPNFSQRSFINNEHETYAFRGISYETSNRKNLNLCGV